MSRRYASKLKVLEDVEDVVGIERGLEAFVFGTDLRGGVSAQDGHGEAADGRKVLNSVAVQQPVSVFAEGHVHRPMPRVFDPPIFPIQTQCERITRDSSLASGGRLLKWNLARAKLTHRRMRE